MNYALCIILTSSCGVDLDDDDGVKTMAAGDYHTIAIKNDGTLWAWGRNNDGQLGLGDDEYGKDQPSPKQVETGKDWIAVSAGNDHTLAIKNDGTLWAWGRNNTGQLGDGTPYYRRSPKQVGTDNDWIAVSGGGDYTLAIKNGGTLWVWGNNGYGQLGDGTNTSSYNPKQVGTDKDWIGISAGYGHVVAIDIDGKVWAWGWNGNGQLGIGLPGEANNKNSPDKVLNSDNTHFSDVKIVSAGSYHSLAIKNDGTLWAWGSNQYGQLGDGTKSNSYNPKQVGEDKDWVSVSGRNNSIVALKSDGTVWAWGRNNTGQLGLGDGEYEKDQPLPKRLGKAADLVGVSGGFSYSTALRRSGILWVWGSNQYGQLGNDTIPTGTVPYNYSAKPIAVKWE